jgi:hypothetical protein
MNSKVGNLAERSLEFESAQAMLKAAKLKKFSDTARLKFNGCPMQGKATVFL